jgi:CTP synthase
MAKHGMICSGLSPDYRLVEIVEIPEHPFFIATQFHPEFRSRPNRAHPLFSGLIEAALKRNPRPYTGEEQDEKGRHKARGKVAEENFEEEREALEL